MLKDQIKIKVDPFVDFSEKIKQQLDELNEFELLYVSKIPKDKIWQLYLDSFPEGTNPKVKERTEHDDSICHHFVQNLGRILAIKDNKLISVWDAEDLPYPYNVVAEVLSEKVKEYGIDSVAYFSQKQYGTQYNLSQTENGIIKWHHLHGTIADRFVTSYPDSKRNETKETYKLIKRTLNTVKLDALETVMDLIVDGVLYRGNEFKPLIEKIIKLKTAYDNAIDKDLFIWKNIFKFPPFKNTAIGQLVEMIVDGEDIETAVKKYEAMVAPYNYKRSKPIVTKRQIEKAKETLEKLDLLDSIYFTDFPIDDIHISNIIWKVQTSKQISSSPFDEIGPENIKTPDGTKLKEKDLPTISVDKFINEVLPRSTKVQLFFEPKLKKHLFSMFKMVNPNKPSILKWGNEYSWSYIGEVADADIKERVKSAGGEIDADIRVSLAWENLDDLDLHVKYFVDNIAKSHIYYHDKKCPITYGELDVDMNVSAPIRGAVENIVWKQKTQLKDGDYKIFVNNYTQRETLYPGFIVELQILDNVYRYNYANIVSHGEDVYVATLHVKNGEITVEHHLKPNTSVDPIWNLIPNTFIDISAVLFSPNHWNKNIGNKHYFFVLKDVRRDEAMSPFYNEYLREDLYRQHRKIFEILKSKLKVEPTTIQTSGVGISETIHTQIIVKVEGAYRRLLKIQF